MLESIYVGLTGLTSFYKGLNVIGNNVANLNTPGFKGSSANFSELYYRNELSSGSGGNQRTVQIGSGVGILDTHLLFKQGELRATGNSTDVGIDGNGLFVLRKENDVFYTRAGQFEFDEQGYLVSRANQGRVAAISGGGALSDINISALKINPSNVTSRIEFVDNLSTGDTSHEITGVTVYDAIGGSHTLKIRLTNNNAVTPHSWILEILNQTDTVLSTGEVRFQGNGSPEANFNTHTFAYTPDGGVAQTITLDFGDAGTFGGVTGFSAGTDSTAKVSSQDGYGQGSLTQVSFGKDGYLTITYSNGQTLKTQQVALAAFDFPENLEALESGLFSNTTGQRTYLDAPGEQMMGTLSGGKLEISNVDLAQQFSELIINQRGYQAASQIVSTANEMIQQLFDIKSKR